MIAFIKGKTELIEEDALVLDQNGIGFRIFVPTSLLDGSIRIGDEIQLYTHLNVREDALQLYGFLSPDGIRMFRMLIGISGVGPKAALSILSLFEPSELQFVIMSGDSGSIAKAQGIGKKTAQKIILELKDKVNLEEAFEQKLTEQDNEGGSVRKEAENALIALGYSGADAKKAVRNAEISPDADVEEVLKAALKQL